MRPPLCFQKGILMGNDISSKPTVAFFDFASCEGCQLQIVNLEDEILGLFDLIKVVNFREAMEEKSDQYEIAFVEGSIERPMDVERLKEIRSKAKVLVALGDCAATGCVTKLRNSLPANKALKMVYANHYPNRNKLFNLEKAKSLSQVVPVDFCIRGCPVRKEQILYYIQRLSWMPLHSPMDSRFGVSEKPIPVDGRSLVLYNPHKCILCRRCDTLCRDALGIDALGLVGKGPDIVISTPKNVGFDNNGCIRCGQCVSACSCGSLVTGSCIPQLIADLQKANSIKIAVDSVALASFVEKNYFLSKVEPSIAEKYILGALKEAGFSEVIQYDRYLLESISKDTGSLQPKTKKLLSWCKASFNYVNDRIPSSNLARSEESSPWTLLLKDEGAGNTCLLSPCTALKGVEGFRHVLSAMELDELFKKLEIDPEFSKPQDYSKRVEVGNRHPGFSPIQTDGGTKVTSLRISKQSLSQIGKVPEGLVDLSPCLARCLTGGGNYPTADSHVIEDRCYWLESLWGLRA